MRGSKVIRLLGALLAWAALFGTLPAQAQGFRPGRAQAFRAGFQFVSAAPVVAYLPASPAPVMAFGLRKMVSGYSGPAIRVRRVSDSAVLDVPFVGQDLDTAAMNTFMGASTLTLVTEYDQSGNGNNRTQATAASQRTINFYNGEWQVTPSTAGVDTVPAITFDRQNASVFSIARAITVISNSTLLAFNSGTDYNLRLITPNSSYGLQVLTSTGTVTNLTPTYRTIPGISKEVISLVSAPTGLKGRLAGTGALSTGTALTSLTASNAGSVASGAKIIDYGTVFYATALSDADEASVRGALASIFRANTGAAYAIDYRGDSIAAGFTLLSYGTAARNLSDIFPKNVRFYSNAVSGTSVGANDNTSYVITGGPVNVFISEWGTNNLGLGNQSATTVYGYLRTMASNARANGYAKVVQCTILPRSDTTGDWSDAKETERLSLNALIRANADGAFDAVCDRANEPTMGNNGSSLTDPARSSNNLTYYKSDKLHTTDAGNALLREVDKAALIAVGVPF